MTPDTVPEAITQADREAAAIIAVGFKNSHALSFAEIVDLIARYRRRLTSHSAGEGLREAWRTGHNIPAVDQRHRDAAAWALDRAPDGMTWDRLTASHVTPERRWQANRVAEAFARFEQSLTPPSDAGSTTRSGGQGVREAAIRYMNAVKALGERSPGTPRTYFDEQPMSDEGSVRWKGLNDAGVALTAALTITSAPGPDPKLIYEALRFYVWAAGEGICPVDGENALEPEEGLFQYSNRTGDEEWETIAERYLATTPSPDASPDSGEAQLVTVADYNAVFDPADEAGGDAFRAGFREGWLFAQAPDGEGYDELAESYGRAVDIEPSEAWSGYRETFFAALPLAALPVIGSPSPPPAIVKEAGEVEVLREALSRIIRLRPAGDVSACRNSRKLVEEMEKIALLGICDANKSAALSASNAAQVSK